MKYLFGITIWGTLTLLSHGLFKLNSDTPWTCAVIWSFTPGFIAVLALGKKG